jgi:hypothetical protein
MPAALMVRPAASVLQMQTHYNKECVRKSDSQEYATIEKNITNEVQCNWYTNELWSLHEIYCSIQNMRTRVKHKQPRPHPMCSYGRASNGSNMNIYNKSWIIYYHYEYIHTL